MMDDGQFSVSVNENCKIAVKYETLFYKSKTRWNFKLELNSLPFIAPINSPKDSSDAHVFLFNAF